MKSLFITLAVCFCLFGCSKSDNEGCKDTGGIVGTWELTNEKGYEIDGTRRDEWTEKEEGYTATYVFDCGNTGHYKFNDGVAGQYSIRWKYDSKEKTLEVTSVEAGDVTVYGVKAISSTALVLVEHSVQPEYEYEYHNESTYRKK